jgi:hypothetical protein
MRGGHPDRLWMTGGALGAAVLLAIGWLLFIGPQKRLTHSLDDQAAAAQLRLTSLQHRLADLRREDRGLPLYRARLARDHLALPTAPALSDFLRELQAAGDNAGVSVTGLLVGAPSQVAGLAIRVHALPITLNATGTTVKLDKLLDQLQQVQPRAVLISSANVIPAEQSGSLAVTVTLTLTLQAFVAPKSRP